MGGSYVMTQNVATPSVRKYTNFHNRPKSNLFRFYFTTHCSRISLLYNINKKNKEETIFGAAFGISTTRKQAFSTG